MKLFNSILFILSVILLFSPSNISAHPGNTDSNDKHSCWTNCSKWGLEYGEYHGHVNSNSSSSPSSSDTNSNTVSEEELSQLNYTLGYEDGLKKGEDAFKENGSVNNYITSDSSSSYISGFKEGFNISWNKAKLEKEFFNLGYEHGFNLNGLNSYIDKVPQNYKKNYREGYTAGEKITDNRIISEVEKVGFENGYTLKEKASPNTTKDIYISTYYESYEDGLLTLLKEIQEEGHNYAYQNTKLAIPDKYSNSPDLANAFTDGFQNNLEVEEIKNIAYANGKFFYKTSNQVPTDYANSKPVYLEFYEKGKSQTIELAKKIILYIVISCITLTTLLLIFILKNKKKRSI